MLRGAFLLRLLALFRLGSLSGFLRRGSRVRIRICAGVEKIRSGCSNRGTYRCVVSNPFPRRGGRQRRGNTIGPRRESERVEGRARDLSKADTSPEKYFKLRLMELYSLRSPIPNEPRFASSRKPSLSPSANGLRDGWEGLGISTFLSSLFLGLTIFVYRCHVIRPAPAFAPQASRRVSYFSFPWC